MQCKRLFPLIKYCFYNIIGLKYYLFHIELFWHLYQNVVDNVRVGPFLHSSFTDLHLSSCQHFMTVVLQLTFEIRQCKPSNMVLSFLNCFDYPRSFKLPYTFLISLSDSTQMPLNLKINLGRTGILTIFSFPILDHRVLLHLSFSMYS